MSFSQDFRISMQRALWGEITPQVRAIALGWEGDVGRARFVFDATPGEHEYETIYNVESEVVSDFPVGTQFEFVSEAYNEQSLGFREGERWWAFVRWQESK